MHTVDAQGHRGGHRNKLHSMDPQPWAAGATDPDATVIMSEGAAVGEPASDGGEGTAVLAAEGVRFAAAATSTTTAPGGGQER